MTAMRREVHGETADALDGVASARADRSSERSEPPWPGFRAGRASTLTKMRGDARSTVVLALVIIVATLAVLGATHVGTTSEDFGAFLGFSLRAEGSLE